jgi:methylated-DNA-[protein]-cysteine S-methyltransferase
VSKTLQTRSLDKNFIAKTVGLLATGREKRKLTGSLPRSPTQSKPPAQKYLSCNICYNISWAMQGSQHMGNIVFETALGHTALARKGEVLLALTCGHSSERSAWKGLLDRLDLTKAAAPPEVRFVYPGDDSLAERICAFAVGEYVDFHDVSIELDDLTSFQRRVIAACRTIPHGETLTYGELAEIAGRPGAARAVGSVMARNRVPLVVPCHRVVPASGGLGGFSAPQGVVMKQRLLDLEQPAAASLA